MNSATKAARARHAEGVAALDEIFGWTEVHATSPRGRKRRPERKRLERKRFKIARRRAR